MNPFFFADSLPEWMRQVGTTWGIRMVCLCSVANFFNVILHILIASLLIWLMWRKRELIKDRFFIVILAGIGFSGASKIIDWYTNMLTATGTEVFFSFKLDLVIEVLQLIGLVIILYGIMTKLFYIHHARTADN